jgi:hypothetical protein
VRRRKILAISKCCLRDMFSADGHMYRVVSDAVPSDVEIVGVNWSFAYDRIEICLESPQWPKVADGAAVPYLDISMSMHSFPPTGAIDVADIRRWLAGEIQCLDVKAPAEPSPTDVAAVADAMRQGLASEPEKPRDRPSSPSPSGADGPGYRYGGML